jgi:hypothetical protein
MTSKSSFVKLSLETLTYGRRFHLRNRPPGTYAARRYGFMRTNVRLNETESRDSPSEDSEMSAISGTEYSTSSTEAGAPAYRHDRETSRSCRWEIRAQIDLFDAGHTAPWQTAARAQNGGSASVLPGILRHSASRVKIEVAQGPPPDRIQRPARPRPPSAAGRGPVDVASGRGRLRSCPTWRAVCGRSGRLRVFAVPAVSKSSVDIGATNTSRCR